MPHRSIDRAEKAARDGRGAHGTQEIIGCAAQPAAAIASTACRTSRVAASGWDTNETCEAGTSTIVAFARSAMNRCSAGGIALSSVPSKYQHGRVVQAGGDEGLAERLASEIEVGALAPVGVGELDGPDRRAHEAAFELLEELLLALAYVA